MESLARLLSRERLLVELVVFKLVTLRQLLLAGETRFLPWAAEEVERATAAVRVVEVERAVLVVATAESRGLGSDPALSALVADTPEPYRTLLAEAQDGLRAGAAEIAELLTVTRRLAEAGSASLAETLRRLDGDDSPRPAAPVAYGSGWSHGTPPPRVEQRL